MEKKTLVVKVHLISYPVALTIGDSWKNYICDLSRLYHFGAYYMRYRYILYSIKSCLYFVSNHVKAIGGLQSPFR